MEHAQLLRVQRLHPGLPLVFVKAVTLRACYHLVTFLNPIHPHVQPSRALSEPAVPRHRARASRVTPACLWCSVHLIVLGSGFALLLLVPPTPRVPPRARATRASAARLLSIPSLRPTPPDAPLLHARQTLLVAQAARATKATLDLLVSTLERKLGLELVQLYLALQMPLEPPCALATRGLPDFPLSISSLNSGSAPAHWLRVLRMLPGLRRAHAALVTVAHRRSIWAPRRGVEHVLWLLVQPTLLVPPYAPVTRALLALCHSALERRRGLAPAPWSRALPTLLELPCARATRATRERLPSAVVSGADRAHWSLVLPTLLVPQCVRAALASVAHSHSTWEHALGLERALL